MKFNIKKEKRCQYFSPDNASTALFSNALNKHIAYLNKKYEDLVLLCIGTDKITGDCLGPLVGSKLMQQNFPHPLYGTLEKPLHDRNFEKTKGPPRQQKWQQPPKQMDWNRYLNMY